MSLQLVKAPCEFIKAVIGRLLIIKLPWLTLYISGCRKEAYHYAETPSFSSCPEFCWEVEGQQLCDSSWSVVFVLAWLVLDGGRSLALPRPQTKHLHAWEVDLRWSGQQPVGNVASFHSQPSQYNGD